VALYGLVWGGPSNHYWQLFLERAVPRRRGDALRPLKKVALEQLTWGPLNNALLMLYLAKAVEGRSWAATWRATAANFGGVQRSGWRLWPAASLVNQTFVPLELRVLWMNAVALVWSTFLISRARPSGGLPPRLPPR
jgi:peroxisomal membrane protein 2